jgi:hypothetical protein
MIWCEDCGKFPAVSHQWRLCDQCNRVEMDRLEKEIANEKSMQISLDLGDRTVFEKTALEVAKLVKEKQLAYGDSFGKSGEVLKLFYPNGIPVDQYTNMLAITRVVDKLFRIATDKDAFGESPWKDINGYSLLALINDTLKKENAQ